MPQPERDSLDCKDVGPEAPGGRFRALVEKSLDALTILAPDGTVLYTSPVITEALGYTPAEYIGRNAFEFMYPDDLSNTFGLFQQILAAPGARATAQHRYQHKDGSWRWLESSGKNLLDDPDVSGVLVRYRDITDQKETEAILHASQAALQLSEKRLSFLAEASRALAATLDYDETLETVVRLVVPFLADWCVVDMVEADGAIRRSASAHRDPSREPLLQKLKRVPSRRDFLSAADEVIHSGEARFTPDLPPAGDDTSATDPGACDREYLQIIQDLGARSSLCVPMTTSSAVLGAITLVQGDRRYGAGDLELAQSLARRAASALENARFHAAVQDAGERAEESRALLQTLLATFPLGFAFLDRDLRYLMVNETMRAIHADSPQDPLGKTLREVVPGAAPVIEPLLRHVLETELPLLNHEVTLPSPIRPGTAIHWQVSYFPVRAGGRVIGLSAIVEDVTDRRRREDGLRFLSEVSSILAFSVAERAPLQAVARLTVQELAEWCVIYAVREEGRLDPVATAHRDPYRESLLQEMVEQFPVDVNTPSPGGDAARTGRSILLPYVPDAMIEDVSNLPRRVELLRLLGTASTIAVPLLAQGITLGGVVLVRGPGAPAYDQADLEVAEEFGRRCAAAIHNARLYHDIQAADRAKDEFLAMLAHELRNPLAAISSAVQVMRVADPDGRNRAIEVAERQSKHTNRLIDDLLDVSRISRGKVHLVSGPVEVTAVIEEAAQIARPMIEARGHQFTVSCTPDPIYVEADRARLEQIIGNLLDNARKYTLPGGRIHLSVEKDGDQVVIGVRDTGIGIEPELLPRIFDLFTQGDRSLDRSQGGLGIGLTLVRTLVNLQGGRVDAYSEGPGKGSQFVVRLPRRDPAPESPTAAAPSLPLICRRVLVVDDLKDSASVLAELLALWGHETRVAHDGAAALEVAHAFHPEVVLLDIGLPGMDGYEVARKLRASPDTADCTLVAVTGYGQESDRVLSHQAGFDRHLTKPVDPTDLQDLLKTGSRRQADR